MSRHIDYIHFNPVKHGLVISPFDWEYSSIHEFCERGYYQDEWGLKEPNYLCGEFGE